MIKNDAKKKAKIFVWLAGLALFDRFPKEKKKKKKKIVERDIQPREESFFLASDFFLSSSRNVGTYRLDFSKEENKKGVLNKDQGKWIAMPRHGKVFR